MQIGNVEHESSTKVLFHMNASEILSMLVLIPLVQFLGETEIGLKKLN